jgi:hypothetical protein
MTNLEDELREMYRVVTGAIREEDLPGLYDRNVRRPNRARFGALAPLAAAVAVVVAIAVAVAVPKLASSPAQPAASAAPAAVPPFAIVLGKPDGRGDRGPLKVVSVATGRITGQVPEPVPDATWFDVATTGSGTRFVAAASTLRGGLCNPTYLYTLTLSARGAVVSLRPYADPVVNAEIGPIAASADGGTLAFVQNVCRGPDQQIGIIRGGKVRKTWREPYPLQTDNLSLSADGRQILYTDGKINQGAEVRMLDTTAAAGNAAAESTVLFSYPAGIRAPTAVIGADPATFYVFWLAGPNGFHLTRTLAGFRIGPGGTRDTLFRRTMPAGEFVSRAGRQVLVWDPSVALYLVDPGTGKATRVQGKWTDAWQVIW